METHLESLCRQLRGRADISVLVANDRAQTVETVLEGVPVTRLGTCFRISSAPVCPSLLARLHHDKSEIVHIHWPNPTAVLAFLASSHRGRLVLTYHSDVIRQKHLDRAFRPILSNVMSHCSAVICSSPNYIDSSPVLRNFRHLCRVIPLGIPVESLDRPDAEAVSRIRNKYGSAIVLTVGRLVSYKGFEHLIRAMSNVDASLLVIGTGPLRNHFERLIDDLNLRTRVHLLGDVDDLVPYYHASDMFVLPSVTRNEAFGIVQLEAMACSKPVINTQIDSGVPFVSPDGVTGLTVKPANPDELAGAIRLLLSDPGLRMQYGRAGRLRVEHEFSLEVMTQRTLELYSEVLAEPARSRSAPLGTPMKALTAAAASRQATYRD
jgi:rhamnosyl/mannosyltransferase